MGPGGRQTEESGYHKVVDGFIRTMERNGVGLATQSNAYDELKSIHRKVGEYRDVPLPLRTRTTIEWYADKHGTTDGYLLRHPQAPDRPFQPYLLQNQWQRLKRRGGLDVPEGTVIYSLRHFFASNCLRHNIPSSRRDLP
ncbi:hypothetical protein OG413_31135 [Streptomyces sp. NBC_01433]|uniref:hypothetical protein n=1 Tax=Streptomyces sp. NBC_01433 TaxID=2903864 RepID=UPI00224F609A|nr:hypothetical protein [Streptomyces sp. NBC_01433]MCX4679686.1 hypothetical protein [Streptomyces sp. NBC_01433]